MELQPGSLLRGRYSIVNRLASGGFGVVYEAIDNALRARVAIKQFEPSEGNAAILERDSTLRERVLVQFEREAQTLANLRHTALPKVTDFFVEDAYFLVMEFIPGKSLRERVMESGALPFVDVVRWADTLLDVLQYIHTQTPPIIHRDIKPDNLKLTERGEIILLDFGMAKGVVRADPSHLTTGSSMVSGYSRDYAPLEQVHGLETSARSDLYALGATLYHLLTGHVPSSSLQRSAEIMAGRPDPIVPAHLLHSSLPQPISDVIMQALSYGENQRFKSAAAMRQALNAAVGNLRYQAVATTAFLPAQGNTPTPAKGVAAPTSVTQPIAQSPSASATKLSATEITPTPATNPSVPLAKKQPKVGASFSSCLIVVLIGIGIVAGVVYGLQQAVSGGITMATSAFTPPPTATPSAVQALASFSSRNIDQLALIDQCSGDSMDGVLDVVVSEPSKRLFTASRDGRIRAWSLQPCTFQQRFVGHNGAVTALALTPDGSTLVSGGEDGTVRIWRIRDGALLETLQGHTAAITDLVVNVNGSRIFSVSSDNQLRRWNVDPPSADGDPISFAQGLLAVAVSSSDLVAVAGSDAIVYTLGVDGNQRDQFNGHTEPINALALSPDSTILASGSGAIIFPKDSTVRLWNVVDGSVRTFEGHTAAVQAVGFSADGQFLVSAGDDKSIRVWQIRDGTIQTMLTHHGAAVTTAFFTSDQHMLITGSLDGTVAIWGIAQ